MSSKKKGGESNRKKEKESSTMGFKINKDLIEMAKGFTVKRIMSMNPMMTGNPATKEEMLAINAKLNKIKKK